MAHPPNCMNHDDPKFTAYALDELEPAERAELEQLLAEDPGALAEIEETRAFAEKLRTELKSEAAEPLRDEQRATVLASRVPRKEQLSEVDVVPFWRRTSVLSALAASVVVALGWTVFFQAA